MGNKTYRLNRAHSDQHAKVSVADHGVSWRVAGYIPQNGAFEPDESQVCPLFAATVSTDVSVRVNRKMKSVLLLI